ncbi:hypothetical protein IDH70_10640 [Mixta calida]|nr:hypothetical protein IDH70_10640 [Mixta calida]
MPETACRATISITLSEWSSRIVSHNDIELEDWVNNALAVYEAEKLACLRAAFTAQPLHFLYNEPEGQCIEDKMYRFFSDKNGDLTAFFSFALNIGYARADRLVAALLTQRVICRGGGIDIKVWVMLPTY